jgi:serine protease DegS
MPNQPDFTRFGTTRVGFPARVEFPAFKIRSNLVVRVRSLLRFLAQMVILGLAAAFVVTAIWPNLMARQNPVAVTAPASTPVPAPASVVAPVVPAAGPASYALAVERAAPAVVNINTAKVVTEQLHPLMRDPFFRQFFGENVTPRKRLETSLGSGVIISGKGYVLTNEHVIRQADAIRVSLRDGRMADADIIGADPDTDLAVLRIKLSGLPEIALANSERVQVGDVVLAIGNPFGVGQTVTMGIVSATGRNQLGINTFENFIQTDAAINPGNSGGALVDAEGRLIGINTAIFSQSGGSVGIGFAIPTSLAKGVMEQIIAHGRPLRGWLGFIAQAVTPQLADALGLSREIQGLVVTDIVANAPAHRAGLRPGDVIYAIDGKKMSDAREILMAISNHKPGDRLTLGIVREGQKVDLDAVTIERPDSIASARVR